MAEPPKRGGLFSRLAESLFEDVSERNRAKASAQAAPPPPPVEEKPPIDPDALAALIGKKAPAQASAELAAMDAAAEPLPTPDRGASELAIQQTHFAARLQEIVTSKPGQGSAGKLQMLNLEELKRDAGDKWEAIADKARSIAEQVISHRLAPSDILAPYDDDSFVVLFAELTEEQARMKAAAIARELRERLLGELGPESRNWVKAYVTGIEDMVPVSGEEATDLGLAHLRALDQKFLITEDVAPPPLLHPADIELQRRVGEVGVSYRPTLLAPKGMIGLAEARTQRLDSLNRLLTGANAFPRNDNGVIFEIDRATLSRALQHLRDIIADGRTPGIMQVSLHLQTLIAHSSGQIIDLLRFLPPDLRRFVIVNLNAQPHNAPRSRLFELAQEIQPFCRSVSFQIPPDFHEIEKAGRLKISAVGIDLDDPEIPEITPSFFTSQILPLAKRAREANILSYLYGVRRKEIAKAARDAGFIYINGPAIAHETRRPPSSDRRMA